MGGGGGRRWWEAVVGGGGGRRWSEAVVGGLSVPFRFAAYGTLAGFNGAYSITFAKFIWLLFDETLRTGGEDEFLRAS